MYYIINLAVLSICGLALSRAESSFNMDEVNSMFYDIKILGDPILKNDFEGDMIFMTNRYGQPYACNLPHPPEENTDEKRKQDSTLPEENIDISVLLKPMKEAPCIIKRKEWWTYEFCYGQSIKQYHMDGEITKGPVLILGNYESEYDWSAGGKGGADPLSISQNNNRLQRFHSQYYTNGTKCDLTDEPRRAEVRFKCESDTSDRIERIDEPESCRYIISIATSRVCHHPYLKPNPAKDPHPIACSPVLDEEKYNKYMQKKQEESKMVQSEDVNSLLDGFDVTNSDYDFRILKVSDFVQDKDQPMNLFKKSFFERLLQDEDILVKDIEEVPKEDGDKEAGDKEEEKTEKKKLTPLEEVMKKVMFKGEDLPTETTNDEAVNDLLSEELKEMLSMIEKEIKDYSKASEMIGDEGMTNLWKSYLSKVKTIKAKGGDAEETKEDEKSGTVKDSSKKESEDLPKNTDVVEEESEADSKKDAKEVDAEKGSITGASPAEEETQTVDSAIDVNNMLKIIEERLQGSGLDIKNQKMELKFSLPQNFNGEDDKSEGGKMDLKNVDTVVLGIMHVNREEYDEKRNQKERLSNYNFDFDMMEDGEVIDDNKVIGADGEVIDDNKVIGADGEVIGDSEVIDDGDSTIVHNDVSSNKNSDPSIDDNVLEDVKDSGL